MSTPVSPLPHQLPLDLPQRAALEREDFLVAPANATAVAWIDLWPGWRQPGLVLYGPAGSGKSHLAAVWRRRAQAAFVDRRALEEAEPPQLLGERRACVVEGADAILEAAREAPHLEQRLLHLYNMLREEGGHLLLTGRSPAARWRYGLADLRSRLTALPAVELGMPDDPLMEAVLVKLFADRQLRVTPDILQFVLARMERSFAAAQALVDALDRAALAERREITVPLAREVLTRGLAARHPADSSFSATTASDDT